MSVIWTLMQGNFCARLSKCSEKPCYVSFVKSEWYALVCSFGSLRGILPDEATFY